MADVPHSLRTWFLIHFYVDLFTAVPLFINPVFFTSTFGFISDPLLVRLVASAMLAIGASSLIVRHAGREAIINNLWLKIIWSTAAVIGLLWSVLSGSPSAGWILVTVFAAFDTLWIYYQRKLLT